MTTTLRGTSTKALSDPTLSLRAKALLAIMEQQAVKKGSLAIKDLHKLSKDGAEAHYGAFHELKDLGYIGDTNQQSRHVMDWDCWVPETIGIPVGWFSHLLHPGGTPDLVACTVLAEIICWHRPVPVFNEHGKLTGSELRFNGGDYWTLDCKALAQKLGYSVAAIRKAILLLAKKRLIKRVIRTVRIDGERYTREGAIPIFNAIIEITKGGKK